MKTRSLALCLFLALHVPVLAPPVKAQAPAVHYLLEASLDTSRRVLVTDLVFTMQNRGQDALKTLVFLVPANAFEGENTTAMRELRQFRSDNVEFQNNRVRALKITSLQYLAIGDQTGFPIQAFNFSDTILRLVLPAPLLPGDSLVIGMRTEQEIRKGRRAHLYVHWFPRLAMRDGSEWLAEPFHLLMEARDVVSAFARFDVTLDVPGNLVVAASGTLESGDPGWQKPDSGATLPARRRLRYTGSRLQNFIWAGDARLVHTHLDMPERVDILRRRKFRPGAMDTFRVELNAALNVVKSWLGPLPVSSVRFVPSYREATAAGGLLIGGLDGPGSLTNTLVQLYIPGITATNSTSEAWLARGLAMFLAKKALENRHGARGYELRDAQEEMTWWQKRYPLPSLDQFMRTMTRMYSNSGQNEAIENRFDGYRGPVGLLANTYLKSTLFFDMLEYVVGEQKLREIFRAFYDRHRYTLAGEAELRRISEEIYGAPLDWFFAQWLHGTPVVDYAHGKTRQFKRDDSTWVTEVPLVRKGNGVMPVEVELEVGGEVVRKRWDGRGTDSTLVFETSIRPRAVRVDPRNRILDTNPLNNRKPGLEWHPDLPLLRLIHMPEDAYLVLWRPLISHNEIDGLRLGGQLRSSYLAFQRNLTIAADLGLASGSPNLLLRWSNPLRARNLLHRYELTARRQLGRYSLDAQLQFSAAGGVVSRSGRSAQFGVNLSDAYDPEYTRRKIVFDGAGIRRQEWDAGRTFRAYTRARWQTGGNSWRFDWRGSGEAGLRERRSSFGKVESRLAARADVFGFRIRAGSGAGVSAGDDPLFLQDAFRPGEASARARFDQGIMPTGTDYGAFSRRIVEGGGHLHGYAGLPLSASRFTAYDVSIGPNAAVLGMRIFGFYGAGRFRNRLGSRTTSLANAGFGLSFDGSLSSFLGGTLPLFEELSFRVYFPVWLSDPSNADENTSFRWLFGLGKQLR